jgi:hypothetical protein
MPSDGRVKTTYDFDEALYEPHVEVISRKEGSKPFYIIYKDHYHLGKALQKIKRSKDLIELSTNYKRY